MGKATGFMEYPRAEAPHREITQRIRDFEPLLLPCKQEHIHTQSARCMDCGVPFCHAARQTTDGAIGCPLGNLIPETNDLAYHDKWAEAFLRLSRKHPFPEITGRVCPALCEGSCTVGQNGDPVAVRDIERTLADFGLKNGLLARAVAPQTGKKVAVVGSGPSGLACAHMLSLYGDSVTVFERDDRPGGFLMYGIPNMKLEKQVVEQRVRMLQAQGVGFRLGCEVGGDYSTEDLVDEFDAVVLCLGARQPRRLAVPGTEAKGVHQAVEYLSAATRNLLDGAELPESLNAAGKRVVVIGGGDTGTDCVATAIRQGAASISAIEIMPCMPEKRAGNNPWPLWPRIKKTDYGHEEAIAVFGRDIREYTTTVKEVLTKDGALTGIVTVRVDWQKGNAGLLRPVEKPETQSTRQADIMLIAMGFTGAEPQLLEKMQIAITPRGTVKTSEGDSLGKGGFKTHLPGVFAAGDVRRGPSLVVWAIQEGIRVARECHEYLKKQGSRLT